MDFTIEPCSIDDIDALQQVGRETFIESFGSMNSREVIEQYLEAAFDRQQLLAELNNQHSRFYLLRSGNQAVVGYLKVNDTPAQSDLKLAESMEIERIYLRQNHKGKGLGKLLLQKALQLAVEMDKSAVWLGVWEKNLEAIGFYSRMGFEKTGEHSFRLGDELQNDFIMTRAV